MLTAVLSRLDRRRHRQRLAARLSLLRDAAPPGAPAGADEARAMRLPGWLRLRLVRAGIRHDQGSLALAAGTMLVAAATALATGSALAAIAALAVPPLGFLAFVEWRAARNLGAFVSGLPFLLDSILQMLRVGNSLQQALIKSAESSGPAIRQFLAPAIQRIDHGVPVPDALHWAAERIALPELRMLAAAVRINSRHGGSMAAILANLARLLREAAQIRRELKAASAEVRFSGLVLMAMPLVIAAMMTAINPAYLRFFIDSPSGPRLGAIAIVLQLTGMAAMRRLMRLSF